MCYNGRERYREILEEKTDRFLYGSLRENLRFYCVTLWGIFYLGKFLRSGGNWEGNNIGDLCGSVTLGKINWKREI